MKIIIKKEFLKHIIKSLVLFIFLIELHAMLRIPIHELGHAVWCEYLVSGCEVLFLEFQLIPSEFRGGGVTHHIGKLSLSDIKRLSRDSDLGQLNFSTVKNFSSNLKYDGKEFDFEFKFKDIKELGNVTLYGKRTELPFKDKINIFSFRMVSLAGPLFSILFLLSFILFLKKIKYPLNFIVPIVLFNDIVYTTGIKGEFLSFLNISLVEHNTIWNFISILFILIIFYKMNKKLINNIKHTFSYN